MIRYSTGKPLPAQFILGLAVIILVSIIIDSQEYQLLVLLLPLIVSWFLLPPREVRIDTQQRIVQKGIFFGRYGFSRTISIPESVKYISMVSKSYEGKLFGGGLMYSSDVSVIYTEQEVNLIYNERDQLFLFNGKKDEIDVVVRKIAVALKLNIYSVTTQQKRWFNYKEIAENTNESNP